MARILIAEDEGHIAHVLTVWLKRHGLHTIEARNGAVALNLLESEPVDLIITDMNMPVLDGLGLIRAVRERMQLSVPIVLLSARCDQNQLLRELEPYRVRIYPKPFMPSKLVADIEQMLARHTEESGRQLV